MLGTSSESDRVNASVWGSTRVQNIFVTRVGWIDAGEELVMNCVAEHARDEPILDIGIGAGRTVGYLRAVASDYVGIDYLEELVDLARSLHPDARIECGDARDLEAFADSTFAAVVFSFNGIDGVAHEDRRKIHAAVLRVLRPGGLFVYSTHNLDHMLAGRPPWDRRRFLPSRGLRAIVAAIARLPRSIRSYQRLRRLSVRGPGWAQLVDSAYNFSVVWHFLGPDEARREPAAAGYADDIELYSTAGAWWRHEYVPLAARRRAQADGLKRWS